MESLQKKYRGNLSELESFVIRVKKESFPSEKLEASGRSIRLGEVLLSATEKLLISESWV